VGNIGLHAKIAEQMNGAIAEVEGAIEISRGSRDLKGDSLRGEDTVAYLGLAVQG
jgi:hypothetical protein